MRKILLTSLILAAFSISFTGCLKDKGFDNGTYGLNDPDTQPQGVGFPLAAKAKNSFGINVSATTQVVNDLVYVNLESGVVAKSDVHITLAVNNTLISDYNAANGATIQVLPASLYSLSTLTLTIPAGQSNVKIPINVLNTTTLNPNQTYGVGLTIAAVDGGYTIASNLKNLLIEFSIKNRLDGVYSVTGAALRAGDPVLTGPVGPIEREFQTSGANSVQWFGTVPWANGGGSALPAGYEPNITVDPVSNLVTSITSPNGIFITAPIVRADIVGATQRYDPATKTLYFEFSYGGGPASRLFSFKAVYVRAR